jgi:hypothetical protein
VTETLGCQADRRFQGAAVNDHLGTAVCTPARWNSDQDVDFLFGGTGQYEVPSFPNEDGDVDRAFLFAGPATGGIDDSANLVFLGSDPHERFGWSVTFIDDVDGDGRSEIAVGAPRGPRIGDVYKDRGRVYIYLSTDSGIPPPADPPALVSSTLASLIIEPTQLDASGVVPPRCFGFSVANVGDVDGDGKGDLAVGAPGRDFVIQIPGRVYVYYGSTLAGAFQSSPHAVLGAEAAAQTIAEFDSPSIPGAENLGDRLGYSIARAGDIDGDGHPDIVAGAPQFFLNAPPSTVPPGHGYLVTIPAWKVIESSGTEDTTGYARIPPAPVTWLQLGDAFGFSVSGGHSFNLDATPEIVVGAPFRNDQADPLVGDSGAAYAVDALSGTRIVDAQGTAFAAAALDNFGWSVLAFPDADDNGIPDIAVGSRRGSRPQLCYCCQSGACCPSTMQGGFGAGRVQLFSTAIHIYGNQPREYARFYGENERDRLGYAISLAGNLGGDARPDLLLSGLAYPFNPADELGRVYLYFLPGQTGCQSVPCP